VTGPHREDDAGATPYATNDATNDATPGAAGERMSAFLQGRFEAHRALPPCPSPADVQAWFDDLLGLTFPELGERDFADEGAFLAHAEELRDRCARLVDRCPSGGEERSRSVAAALHERLPDLHAALEEDATAILRGDPAARNRDEVIRTYPGFRAIAGYRVAHALHQLGVPLLARMVSTYAHRTTGIDIHPAARIGRRFCIDHGTGIVIGATAIVGDDVKMYQAVTLGGLSVRKEDAQVKRHPTIEDRVVLYAGATILGGSTVVGQDSVIGGNVWLTRSVPPYSKVSYLASIATRDVRDEGSEPEAT
jgi:serine O-acetyltransferase